MQKQGRKGKKVRVQKKVKKGPNQPHCSKCLAKVRMNYPHGRKSRAVASILHYPSCRDW